MQPAWEDHAPKPAAAFPRERTAHQYRGGVLRGILVEIRKYPSAIVGLAIIAVLIGVSIYTVIAYPYSETLVKWSGVRGIWDKNPKFAQPTWSNLFRSKKLPLTIALDSQDSAVSKTVEVESSDMKKITFIFPFDYPYNGFPQEFVVNIKASYIHKAPFINLIWVTPDKREVKVDTFIATSSARYSFEWQHRFSPESIVNQRTGPLPWDILFSPPGGAKDEALKGAYQLRVEGYVFEPDANIDADMVLYGEVYGLAGTDDQRRDLKLAVLWGTPFSLIFGLLGAFGTGLLAMIIAATSIWFGGWVDALIQRITEVNMLLPALPMAIMIYFLYTKNIWIILAVIILLSVFGNAIKNYRAAFLQVKESGYVQAAQVYGASNVRIILRYLVPRIIPLLVPQLVALVPSYIFLEPTLAFLGVTDPTLPTWGKILMTGLYTAQEGNQIYYITLMREPYLALQPIFLMFVTGLAFSLLGMALDRIFNPRLRSL
jgi:peptide/nickel transport system permease protein